MVYTFSPASSEFPTYRWCMRNVVQHHVKETSGITLSPTVFLICRKELLYKSYQNGGFPCLEVSTYSGSLIV